ncbi:MAG: type II secretion system F family protein, partial [Candidatus Sumerlaeota bacterium]
MPKFEYLARDTKGERITGVIEVDDRQAVVGRLQTMGYYPVRISNTTPSGSKHRSLAHIRGRVATSQMVDFQRQLADLMQAGVPLVKSLNIIVNQTQDELLREIVADISKNVQGGDTLARAMSRHPKTFNTITVAMVRAGEMGGMLPDILERLADFSENESELKSKVISSLTYPIIMVLAGIVVIAILLIVVIPKITSVYSSMGQELPLITRMLISLTNSFASYWWLIILGVIAAVFLFRKFIETREGKLLWHRFLLKLPVLGRVILLRQLALFSRTFGNLLRNGVPILQALEITERVIGNAVLLREIHKLSPAISQGEAMAS